MFIAAVLLGASLAQTPLDEPHVQFTQTHRTADVITVEWVVDRPIDEARSRVFFQPADQPEGAWREVLLPQESRSGVRFRSGAPDSVVVRVTVTDSSGHVAAASVVLPAVPLEIPPMPPPSPTPLLLSPAANAVMADPFPPSAPACTAPSPEMYLVVNAGGGYSSPKLPHPSQATRWQQVLGRAVPFSHLPHLPPASLPHLPQLPPIDPRIVGKASELALIGGVKAGVVAVKGGVVVLQIAAHVASHLAKK